MRKKNHGSHTVSYFIHTNKHLVSLYPSQKRTGIPNERTIIGIPDHPDLAPRVETIDPDCRPEIFGKVEFTKYVITERI